MFLVGLELDTKMLHIYARQVIMISSSGIIVPFSVGSILGVFLYPILSKQDVAFTPFVLFIGAAMSITAFPVLARILEDHHLNNTQLGTIVIASAAINDVSGWCILAGLLIFLKSAPSSRPLWMTLFFALIYFCTIYLVSRILPHIIARKPGTQNHIPQDIIALFLLLVLASSLVTEWLGIYPLFGAFMVGLITPRQDRFNLLLKDKLYDMTVVLLLPIFFALTGLRTSMMLLNSEKMWVTCGVIILAAMIGKFGGSAITARLAGMSWRESNAVGILMNTRGLMELILLNVGLEYGLISQTVFTLFVLMAVFTTLITTPLLETTYTRHLNA